MNQEHIEIVATSEARRVLTRGDIRDEIAFQNDINSLLARLDEPQPPLQVDYGSEDPARYAAAALAVAVPSFSRSRK